MQVRKRNGKIVEYDREFIVSEVTLAAAAAGEHGDEAVQRVVDDVEAKLGRSGAEIVDIEAIQDAVEEALFEQGRFKTAKAYILYRMEKEKTRGVADWKEGLLSREFLSKYKHAPSPMGELGSFVYSRTYSRYIPQLNRREFWWETVRRAVEYNCSLAPTTREEAEKLYDNIYNLRQFLSGRTLWVGQTPVSEAYPMANYNCAFEVIDDYHAYHDLFYLLMVGSATERKLAGRGIHTIGDLAGRDPGELTHWLGKMGQTLFLFANGLDQTPVACKDDPQTIKSIGNSTTTSRDLVCEQDVSLVFWVLAECVARRMRAQKLKGRLVSIQVRDKTLSSFTRQHQRKSFTNLASELEADALALFRANYHWSQPIRSVGLSVGDFDRETVATQLEFFTPEIRREKEESVERTVDVLKQRFGNASIGRAALLLDPPLTGFNPYEDHTIHPVGYRPQNNRDGG